MEKESSFVVRDRRAAFSDEAEAPPVSKEPPQAEHSEKKAVPDTENAGRTDQAKKTGDAPHHIPVNFPSFILSLATSALIHLGEEADPSTGRKSVELPNARQVIDLITMLEEKTRGNLSKEEEHLLEQLLYTLRMKYVALEKNHRP